MSVFQCKSGRHTGKWAFKFKKSDGKWSTKYCVSEEDAHRQEQEIGLYIQEEEKVCTPKVYTIGDLAVLYYQANERISKKLMVYFFCGYERKGRHVRGAGEFLRDRAAEDLNRKDLEQMRQNLREMHQAGPSSINHYQAHIRAILAWAVDQELISYNPWAKFKRLPVKRRAIEVSYEDVQAVYEVAPDWLKWAIKTAYCLCLRPGIVELFNLKWRAFDWRRGIVRVIQGKSGIPKTVIPPDAYMAEARQRYESDRAEGIELVCTRYGRTIYAYNKAWDKACKQAGVKIRFYDVRHLAASEMLANGADLAAVAAQLGHQNVATTGKNYAHVMAGAQKKAGMSLPSL